MTSVKDLLKSAKLPERIVPICLRGDLVAQMDDLLADMKARPATSADDRLGAARPNQDIEDALEALRAEMVAATVPFRLRSINRSQMDAIVLAHPPKDDLDKQIGYAFNEGREEVLRAALVDPVVASDDDWQLLRGALSLGQWEQLVEEANKVASARPEAPTTPFFPGASPSTRESPAA